VLLFRDQAIEAMEPTALSIVGASGHQAISLSFLPDFKPVKVKHLKSIESKPGIDFDPAHTYAAHDAVEETKEVVFVEPKANEYIFLIDRSGSMDETIFLARQALQLFL